jgi:hypothetical protein
MGFGLRLEPNLFLRKINPHRLAVVVFKASYELDTLTVYNKHCR